MIASLVKAAIARKALKTQKKLPFSFTPLKCILHKPLLLGTKTK